MAKQAIAGASRLNAFSMNPEDLTVVTDMKNALYDERSDKPLDENMVLNIMAYGVKQPVIVRKNGEELEVVDGRQRTRCAIEANKRLKAEGKERLKVPVMLARGEDKDMFGIAIFCNEIRSDDTPMVRAKKAQRLIDLGKSIDEAAIVFGVTKAAINQWLALLELAPAVQKAVEAGEVSASAVAPLRSLSREDQIAKLAELRASGEKVTAKKTSTAVKNAKGETAHDRPSLGLLQRLYKSKVMVDEAQGFLGWVLGEQSAKQAEMVEVLASMEASEKDAKAAKRSTKARAEKKAKAAG